MGLLKDNIEEVDALDFLISENFLINQGYTKSSLGGLEKKITMKGRNEDVEFELYFYVDPNLEISTGGVYRHSFWGVRTYNPKTQEIESIVGMPQFSDYYSWLTNPVRTLRQYFEFLEYLKERALLL